MKLWLLVPVKPFAEGKSRLASSMNPTERAALSRYLLHKVLETALATRLLAGVVVVSRDPQVRTAARSRGADILAEEGNSLNTALRQARQHALDQGADAILVLPTDLPLITAGDIHTLWELGNRGRGVVVAPSRDGGTNALLLRPPDLMDFAFGPASCRRHREQAEAAGYPFHLFCSSTLALDLDSPEDLTGLPPLAVSQLLGPGLPDTGGA